MSNAIGSSRNRSPVALSIAGVAKAGSTPETSVRSTLISCISRAAFFDVRCRHERNAERTIPLAAIGSGTGRRDVCDPRASVMPGSGESLPAVASLSCESADRPASVARFSGIEANTVMKSPREKRRALRAAKG